MKNLELVLPTKVVQLNLGDEILAIREKLTDSESDYFSDSAETFNEYLSYSNLGFELLFEDEALASIFLYIYHKADKYAQFKNSCSYLDNGFWESPNLEKFKRVMISNAFTEKKTGSKFTAKFIKDDLYIVYNNRPDKKRVSFGLE